MIKLAILEKDTVYLRRFASAFEMRYSEKLQIYSFTDPEITMSSLDESRIDVLLANDVFQIDVTALPRRCGFAYLVNSADVNTVNDQHAICKFQKADQIYRQILSIYSEKVENITGLRLDDASTRVVIFSSVSGGAGASSMAAAYAMRLARQGKKTLYLNIEKFSSSDLYFTGDGQYNMSDIIFVVKRNSANLSLKLESYVRQSENGVYFYAQSRIALDMFELSSEELINMISVLKSSYDYIVIDSDFSLDKKDITVYKQAHRIIWVGDGSESSNNKISRAYTAMIEAERDMDVPLSSRIKLIYNMFSSTIGREIVDIDIISIGGAPRYKNATTIQVIQQLSELEMLDQII